MLQRVLQALKTRHPSLALSSKEQQHPAAISPKELLPGFNPIVTDLEPTEVSVHKLPNGIPVVIESSPSLPRCSLIVSSGFGTRHLPAEDSALLFAVQVLAFRSGSPESESRILSGLEVLGGAATFSYTQDSCNYHLSCFKHHFPQALQAIVTSLTAERKEKDELVAKARMAEYCKVRADVGTISERVREIWLRESLGLGLETCGKQGDIAGVTNERVNSVIAKIWSRENVTLGFSGPADPSKVLSLLASSFSSLSSSPPPIQTPGLFRPSQYLEDLDCSRAHGIISYPSVPISSPLFPAFQLLLEAIGREYQPHSHLSSSLRRKIKGELQEVEKFRAISGHFKDVGVIGVEFTAESSGKWANTVQIADKTVDFIRNIDSEALEVTKKSLKLRIAQVFADPERRLRHLVRSQALLGTVRLYEDELKLVDSVDLQAIRLLCDQILSGKSSIIMLGPVVSQLAKQTK